jgi:hypothetical protein
MSGAWSVVWAPIVRIRRRIRRHRLRRSGVDKTRRWRPRVWVFIATVLTWIFAVIFMLWLLRSAIGVIRGHAVEFPFGFNPDSRCTGSNAIGVSCGAITGFLTSVASIALASVLFLLFRLWRAVRRYRKRARIYARDIVPTAGGLIGDIVGREELCQVIMADLHDRKTRRPHVLIGGVGTGKTAVLVKLTELLAERGAVPVPVRLREAEKLDFAELGKEQFTTEINRRLASTAEGEKIWRRLLQDGRIVVLADGLEEAFAGGRQGNQKQERDNLIRLAIQRAHKQRLALVIASRPHAPLREMEANISDLEPLSEEAALHYVAGDNPEPDERLERIVETAEVAEAPLYLQITRELYQAGRLGSLSVDDNVLLDTRNTDRATLRLALLSTWERALVRGDFYRHVVLKRSERKAAIEWMSALACVGLVNDSIDVQFSDAPDEKGTFKELHREVKCKVPDFIDVRLAATYAAKLGLVEAHDDKVRFHHSLMQAYLGSRLMGTVLPVAEYMERALPKGRGSSQWDLLPGREFLIALVLHSRRQRPGRPGTSAAPGAPPASGPSAPPCDEVSGSDDKVSPRAISCLLRDAASWRTDVKALDILAAAFEIGCIANEPLADIAATVTACWKTIRTADGRTCEEAKLNLIRRFGAALRVYATHRPDGQFPCEPAYRELYAIACRDDSYPIQLAVAQELGAGGATAYRALEPILAVPADCELCRKRRDERREQDNKDDKANCPPPEYDWLSDDAAKKRAVLISAWLAPLLIGSVSSSREKADRTTPQKWVEEDLEQWLRHVGPGCRPAAESDLPLAQEIALAQGFKYAANRRGRHPSTQPEARAHLAEQAQYMLMRARYWFSQLTLIQASCLWQLPDRPDGNGRSRQENRLNPSAVERRWLEDAGVLVPLAGQNGEQQGRKIHPFVEQAADLASRALEIEHPQRFIWIDEVGVVSRVGSRRISTDTDKRRPRLWIPPSTGWSALHPRAQQLVADVLLLWNLAARGDQPIDIEQRLERANRADLPYCLKRDRGPLAPEHTVGMADTSQPGGTCTADCNFDLCPYPSIGEQRERVELSEAFCRRQRTLLRVGQLSIRRGTAPWQGIWAGQLRRFWGDMADRARGSQPGADEQGAKVRTRTKPRNSGGQTPWR